MPDILRAAFARQTRAALATSAKKGSPAPTKTKGGKAVAMAGSKKGAGKAEKQTAGQDKSFQGGEIKRVQEQQKAAAARNVKVRLVRGGEVEDQKRRVFSFIGWISDAALEALGGNKSGRPGEPRPAR